MKITSIIKRLYYLDITYTNVKNWIEFLYNHILKKNKEMIIVFRNGTKFKINSNSGELNMLFEIWFDKEYTPTGYKIHKDNIVIDIGANIGGYTIYSAQKCKKVYAFEPYKPSYKKLLDNIIMNDLNNVIPYNYALGFPKGKKKFYSNYHSGRNSFYKNPKPELEFENHTVSVITLNSFIKQNKIKKIDLLKMDCEGAEYEILFNLNDKDYSKIKRIVMETHDFIKDKSITDIYYLLKSKGYSIKINGAYLYATKENHKK